MAARVLIVGTGLIGASLGLALKALGTSFDGSVVGWDADSEELATARRMGAIDEALPDRASVTAPQHAADIYVLATPVLPILDWMQQLASVVPAGSLITDVGSTKGEIVHLATALRKAHPEVEFLPSHPMAGKERGGADLAEATLFRDAAWLFTPLSGPASPRMQQWRTWIRLTGADCHDIDPWQHDRVCAWVSHLPQMLSTALAAVLSETFAADPAGRALVDAIGGRALRETTRLGSSPYTMWRDIALTNAEPLGATLFALEQEIAHLRENLKSPELRRIFQTANRFKG